VSNEIIIIGSFYIQNVNETPK